MNYKEEIEKAFIEWIKTTYPEYNTMGQYSYINKIAEDISMAAMKAFSATVIPLLEAKDNEIKALKESNWVKVECISEVIKNHSERLRELLKWEIKVGHTLNSIEKSWHESHKKDLTAIISDLKKLLPTHNDNK